MKRSNPEQTAAQAVGTWSEMVTALGSRRGVRHISQAGDCHSPLAQRSVTLFTQTLRLYWGAQMYPLRAAGHICTCVVTEELTMEAFYWMLLIPKHNKPKRYWIAFIHGHKTVIQVWN